MKNAVFVKPKWLDGSGGSMTWWKPELWQAGFCRGLLYRMGRGIRKRILALGAPAW